MSWFKPFTVETTGAGERETKVEEVKEVFFTTDEGSTGTANSHIDGSGVVRVLVDNGPHPPRGTNHMDETLVGKGDEATFKTQGGGTITIKNPL